MTNSRSRFLFLVVAMLGLFTSVLAGPYEIRRSDGDAAATRAVSVLATTSFAPYDDVSGTLSDGNSYYYMVEDFAGAPLSLSVHKNQPLDAVRLSFDDGDPTSADVGAAQSTVTVSPATIPANGVTTAVVRVVPRDAAGVPLGTGLDLSVDSASLDPGEPSGSFVDHGNGIYTLDVVSFWEGVGNAVVTVEGMVLADAPQVTYEFADPNSLSSDLIQIARELEALLATAPGAVSTELGQAVEDIYDAVDELNSSGVSYEQAITSIARSLADLADAGQAGWSSELVDAYSERLAAIARRLALEAIAAALAAGVDSDELDDAYEELSDGDWSFARGNFISAVSHYIEVAEEAEEEMND